MKLQIKTGGGVGYARKEPYEYDGTKYEADVKNGDIVTVLDSGIDEQGTYGTQIVFKIKTRNGEKRFPFNQQTINVLVQELGDETENWIGKNVKVILRPGIYGGKKGIAGYLVTDNWGMDEYGELYKSETPLPPLTTSVYPRGEAQPTQPEQSQELRAEDIPF